MEQKSKDRLLDYFIAGLLAVFIIGIASQIWKLDLNVLPAASDDKMLGAMLFKSIKENGLRGIWVNPSIGAPEMSSLIDTPFIDYPLLLLIWVLVKVLPSSIMAYYALYFLSFPLTAAAMLFLLNRFSTNRFLNIIMSTLFSAVPYHFLRGSLHSTLSCYYAIPIGIYLALVVFNEKFQKGSPEFLKESRWKKIFFWLAVVYVGLSNVYYAFFTMLIILVAVVYKMINNKTWKPMLQEARVFYIMAAAFIAGILPKLLYGIIYGSNTTAGIRQALETEIYSLKIIQMLLPPPYSRIGLFRDIANNYLNFGFNVNENAYACLGFIGTIGFLILCTWTILRLVKGSIIKDGNDRSLNILSCFTLVLVLWCTAGGFGTIFSYVVTAELRCLNRASIMIAAIGVLAFVLACNKIQNKLNNKLFHVLIGAVFIMTIFLDVPVIPQSEQQISEQEHMEYTGFFEKVQNTAEKNSMIYQLPMTKFPEAPPVNKMKDYSLFLGYVYTEGLKWSYGGEYGRNDAAMELYIDKGMSARFVEQIISQGFQGIYIDTYGFEDGGAEINNFYQNVLGLNPIVSQGKRLYFYSLKQLDSDKLQGADTVASEHAIRNQVGNLYFSLTGAELKDELCKAAAKECSGLIDYEVVYDYLFDNPIVDKISHERFTREIYFELLKREASKDELENICKNLEAGLTRKDIFIQLCSSEEFRNQ